MTKIYVLDSFDSSGIDYARARGAEVVLWTDPRVKGWHEDADAVMVRSGRLTADDFTKARKLRIVAKQGVGVNTLDLDAAKRHGIVVFNTPGVNSEAVAEMALALTLSVSRRTVELDRRIRAGEPIERSRFLGLELSQKTVGVIGMGNIGVRAARKFHAAFDMRVLAYDKYAPADAWPDIPHERLSDLDDIWSRVDVLTVHVPLTDETRDMVGRRELDRMKDTAILVNVSRGGIINEAALYDVIKSGRIFGAGLDVFTGVEPPPADHPLLSLPNVVVTPHAAGGTRETQHRSSLLVAEQLFHVLGGGEPLNRVV